MAPPTGPEKKGAREETEATAPAPEPAPNPEKPAQDASKAGDAREAGDTEAAGAQTIAESTLKEWPAGVDVKKKSLNAVQTILEKRDKGKPLSEEEQKIFEWANPSTTSAEKEAALTKARKLLAETWKASDPKATPDSMIPVASEIDHLASEGKIDFRETKALNSYLVDLLKNGTTIPRMSEAELKKFREDFGLDELEEKGNFWERLAKLAEKVFKDLEKWLEIKLAGEGVREAVTGKKVEKQDRKFSKSPVGDKPLAFNRRYEVGKGVEIKSEKGTPILATEKGKVAVDGSTVTVARENGVVITYENIVPEPGINGKEVNGGDAIGKTAENGLFVMKLADSSGAEQNITDYLPEPVKTNA